MFNKSYLVVLICVFSCFSQLEEKKAWTVMIYMAANNDLDIFAIQNIRQMLNVGSNEQLNIIIFLAQEHQATQENYAKIIKIEKDNQLLIKTINNPKLADSGDPKTLIQFCTNTIAQFPAEHYALIFWNHGTGVLDPSSGRTLILSESFQFEYAPSENQSYATLFPNFQIIEKKSIQKAVCFDEVTGNFLKEKDLDFALKTICKQALNNNKFDIIGFDTCLMAMIEVIYIIKNYAYFMVASQEVERGAGWNYKKALSLFQTKAPSPLEFANHIVKAYAKTYHFANDYTLSCADLSVAHKLESNIKELALLLQKGLSSNPETVAQLLRTSRYKHHCIHFDEPDYIDLDNFFRNLLRNVAHVAFANALEESEFKRRLSETVTEGIELIKTMIVANKAGSSFDKAKGVSIYFPERALHKSYKKSQFSVHTGWLTVIQQFLAI